MIQRDALPSGVRIVSQRMEHCRSVALGIWVKAGSVYEGAGEQGASHFIEHILFKGTKSRSAAKIAAEMDDMGGNLNAFTSKECTCYYAKVLDEHMERAVDIMSDLFLRSSFDGGDIAREKGVVAEEISMNDDSPEDVAHEGLCAMLYRGMPLSAPVLGTRKSVEGFERDSLLSYMGRRYRGEDMVISCAGSFEMDRLKAALSAAFGDIAPGRGEERLPSALTRGRRLETADKDVEQGHICIGLPGFGADDPRRFAMLTLNNALGGCMSSRLFQKIREERGLAYSIYTYPTSYAETGYLTLYAGSSLSTVAKVTELMLEEVRAVRKNGLSMEEFRRAKEQMRVGYLLGQEGSSARCASIGKAELLLGHSGEEEKLLKKLEAVTMEDVEAILPEVLDEDAMCAFVVGREASMDMKGIEKLILET